MMVKHDTMTAVQIAEQIFGKTRFHQEKKIERFQRMLAEHMIEPQDLDLVQMIDDPAAVVEAIFKYYEKRGFAPLPTERENLLNL